MLSQAIRQVAQLVVDDAERSGAGPEVSVLVKSTSLSRSVASPGPSHVLGTAMHVESKEGGIVECIPWLAGESAKIVKLDLGLLNFFLTTCMNLGKCYKFLCCLSA